MVPDCSIIIPAYNAGNTIIETLESIELDKEWNHTVEVIVVDDGSTDNTMQIISEYAAQHSDISVISQRNNGVSSARNNGIKNSRGRYIFFIDADDRLFRDSLEKMITIADNTNVDLVISDYDTLNLINNNRERCVCKLPYNVTLVHDTIIRVLTRYFIDDTIGLSNLWNKLFRKSVITGNGINFDERRTHGEDWAFCIQYFRHIDTLYAIDDAVYEYRLDGSQDRSKYRKELAYCLLNGNQIIQNLNNEYLHFSEQSEEYLEAMRSFYYQIVNYLKLDCSRKEKKSFLKAKEVRNCIMFLSSLEDTKLLKADFSRKDKLSFNLLRFGFYHVALRII